MITGVPTKLVKETKRENFKSKDEAFNALIRANINK